MTALSPNLLDTDFKQLVTLARSLLPQHAPDWTDHNLHDPGIMLIELLAWVTEAQIYSLARVRKDERWAFGALFGMAPRGTLPARGMAWPNVGSPAPGALVAAGALIDTGQPQVPVFRLREPLNLTPATLSAVETWLHDGRVVAHTGDTGFDPFGAAPGPHDRLVLTFDGPLLAHTKAREAFLSIGVRVGPGGAAPGCTRLSATLLDGQQRYPMPLHADDSAGFTRSGVLLLSLRHVPDQLGARFHIAFNADGCSAAPRIMGIAPNVLPMEQIASETAALRSDGAPDQFLMLADAGILFPQHAPSVRVQAPGKEAAPWRACADLAQAGPADPVYRFDPESARIRFGNGVNGRIPPLHAQVLVDYAVTEGESGNLAPGRSWRLQGGTGLSYVNLDSTAGGMPPLNLDQLRRQAREQVRQSHPIVTAVDLEQAAMRLGAARAQSLAPDQHACALPSDWVLVALSAPAGQASSRRWLDMLRRALTPRVLLGERLRVVAPEYVALRVEATLAALPGYDTAIIERAARALLEDYFKLVGDAAWPLGRAVRVLDLQGRLMAIDGVAGVPACALFRGLEAKPEQMLRLPPTGLPLFQSERSKFGFTSGARP